MQNAYVTKTLLYFKKLILNSLTTFQCKLIPLTVVAFVVLYFFKLGLIIERGNVEVGIRNFDVDNTICTLNVGMDVGSSIALTWLYTGGR